MTGKAAAACAYNVPITNERDTYVSQTLSYRMDTHTIGVILYFLAQNVINFIVLE